MLRYAGTCRTIYDGPGSACATGGDPVISRAVQRCSNDFLHSIEPPATVPAAADSALVTKLTGFAGLDGDEIAELRALSHGSRSFGAEQILIHEGLASEHLYLLVDGLACRYKMLPGGRRQILGYLIPGDLCDPHFTVFNRPDHSVALLCDSLVAKIPIARIAALKRRFPTIDRALSLAALIDGAILREWLLSVGQRDAFQKVGHFFCEMEMRLNAIGRVDEDGSFDLPVNQATLADTTGLTSVHVNRTLQRLRREGLIMLRNRRLKILDFPRLQALAGFEGGYLRMRGQPETRSPLMLAGA